MLCRLENVQLDWPSASRWHYTDNAACVYHEIALKSGDVLWLQGDNGVGKSTWMRMVSGLLPMHGKISWQLLPDVDLKSRFYTSLGLESCDDLSVLAFLQHEYLFRVGGVLSDASCRDYLLQFGLEGALNDMVGSLSSGQRKRLTMVSLLYDCSAVWLLDEPFVFLDVSARAAITGCIQRHIVRGGSVVWSGHDAFGLSCGALRLERRYE